MEIESKFDSISASLSEMTLFVQKKIKLPLLLSLLPVSLSRARIASVTYARSRVTLPTGATRTRSKIICASAVKKWDIRRRYV